MPTSVINVGQGIVCGFNNSGEFYIRNGYDHAGQVIQMGGDAAKKVALEIINQYGDQFAREGQGEIVALVEIRKEVDKLTESHDLLIIKLHESNKGRVQDKEMIKKLRDHVRELQDQNVVQTPKIIKELEELRAFRDLHQTVSSEQIASSTDAEDGSW